MNDLDFVLGAVDFLWARGLRTWVSGGWGEELRGLVPPCEHAGLELLYPARDWSRLDALQLEWVAERRRRWQRAFVLEGAVVELSLVERDERGWYTRLGSRRHDWPHDVFSTNGRIAVASSSALEGLRPIRRRAA